MHIFKNTNFDFLRTKHIAFTASGALILAGLIALYVRGKDNMDIDFSGGTMFVRM